MEDFRPIPDGVRLALSGIGHGYAGARVLDDVSLELRGGEVDLPARAVGLRQVDAAAHRRRRRAAGRRARCEVGGRRGLGRDAPRAARGRGDRADVPGLRALPAPDRGAERRLRPRRPAGGARRRGCGLLLERVGLARHGDKYPHQLSGGEQQRVALARALAPRPPILLMDEPFSGLDNRLRDGIRDETLAILKEEGAAVLLVTHEPDEAMRMADRIALMRDGRIVQQGAPYTIYNNPVDREAASSSPTSTSSTGWCRTSPPTRRSGRS